LVDFIRGRPFKKINNLIYQEGKEIKFNPIKNLNLNHLPRQDFSFLDIEEYFRLQNERQISPSGRIAVFSRKGCGLRSRYGPCFFCSIMYREKRLKSPLKFFRELDFLIQKYKPGSVWDVSDDFLDDKDWFLKFHRLYRRYPTKPELRVYVCLNELDGVTIKRLAELNVKWIIFGIEGGDDKISSSSIKNCSTKEIKAIFRCLNEYGINACIQIVLGGIGESPATLKSMIKLTCDLKERYPTTLFLVHFLRLLPGTLAHRLLIQKTGSKYQNRDFFDPYEAFLDWLKYFTTVSYSQVLKAFQKIPALKRN